MKNGSLIMDAFLSLAFLAKGIDTKKIVDKKSFNQSDYEHEKEKKFYAKITYPIYFYLSAAWFVKLLLCFLYSLG